MEQARVPDELESVLRLVAEGRLTPEEAEPILAALGEGEAATEPVRPADAPRPRPAGERRIRIQVLVADHQVVNLRVPLGIAGVAASLVPGLSERTAERIRQVVRAGEDGTILDVVDEDGDRVIISVE